MTQLSLAPTVDLILESDGATKKTNPGPSGWGFVALGPWGDVIYEDCGLIPQHCTSNEAEYWAAVKALEFARDLGYPRVVELRADSLTMIRQLEGRYGFRSDALTEVANRALGLIEWFDQVDLVWIPRRFNSHANALASAAFAHNPNREMRKIKRSDFEPLPGSWKEWNDQPDS